MYCGLFNRYRVYLLSFGFLGTVFNGETGDPNKPIGLMSGFIDARVNRKLLGYGV